MMQLGLFVSVLAAAVFGASSLIATATEKVPGKSDAVDISRAKSEKPVAKFGHLKHIDMKIPCKTCHHASSGEKAEVKCSVCHKAQAEGKVLSTKDAFHKQCIDCHRDKLTTSPKSHAPTKCRECH